MDIETLLQEWDLPQLIEPFKANEITPGNLNDLSEDLIKELIPVVGQRIKFTKHFQTFKENSLFLTLDTDSVSQTSSNASTITSIDNNLYVVPIDMPLIEASIEPLRTIDYGVPEFDLKTLLSVSPYGDLITNYYRTKNTLNDFLRNKLVDIIIKHLYLYIIKHRLNHADYNILCAKIIKNFPSECSSTYYQSGKRCNKLAVQAKGKLVDKIRNLLYKSPDKVYVRKRRHADIEGNGSQNEILTDEHTTSITWLKYNREPWDEVVKHWKVTHELRQQNCANSVAEFITSWPSIEDPRASSLVEVDFQLLFPEKEMLLLNNWGRFFEIIFNSRNRDTKDPSIQDLSSQLEMNAENLSESSKCTMQLMLLVKLIPPKGRMFDGKKQWKFSTVESEQAILVHCLGPGDIQPTINNINQKALKRKVYSRVQPYLIVVGATLTNITSTYLIIDKIQFQFSSTLKAFDILFKTFFSINIKYPPQAEHVYYLVQKGIYKINLDNDKSIPYISDLLSALTNEI